MLSISFCLVPLEGQCQVVVVDSFVNPLFVFSGVV